MTASEQVNASFATIPETIKRRVEAGEKLLLILIDAFGLEFLPRHSDHPLIQRLDVTALRSQFPTTTTAHIPTLAFGMPVQQHGWYEWNVYEPKLDDIFCPFRWALSDGHGYETHASLLPPADNLPGPTFARSLDAPAANVMPAAYAHSIFTRFCADGAQKLSFEQLGDGVMQALDWLHATDPGQGAYAFLYWDDVDTVGHLHGPSSEAFDASARRALDQLELALAQTPQDVAVLFTADHGQIDVSPDRVDYLDRIWPQLTEHLRFEHPAGSARDVFLHVKSGSVELVIDELANRLEGHATVDLARNHFGEIGPRLEARLADVLILPEPGREAWISSKEGPHLVFKGHHGGHTDAESGTYLAELQR